MALSAWRLAALKEQEEKEKERKAAKTATQDEIVAGTGLTNTVKVPTSSGQNTKKDTPKTTQSSQPSTIPTTSAWRNAAQEEQAKRGGTSTVSPQSGSSSSGGRYYSQPNLYRHKEGMDSALDALELTLKNRQSEVENALQTLEQLYAKVEANPRDSASISQYNATYSQYEKLFKEYEEARNAYNAAAGTYNTYMSGQQREYDEWKSTIRDSDAIMAELEELNKRAKEVKQSRDAYAAASAYGRGHTDTSGMASKVAELTAELDEIEKQRGLLVEEKRWSEHFDYADLMQGADFKDYAAKGAAIENPTADDAEGWFNLMGWRPGAEDVGNVVTYSRENLEDIKKKEAQAKAGKALSIGSSIPDLTGGDVVGNSLYGYMTEDEVAIYNYLLAKEGKESAQKYLDHLEEYLNQREGTEMGEYVRGIDNWAGRVAATGAYGLAAGVDQFTGGMKQLFTSEDLPTSAIQYGSQYIQEDLADKTVGKHLYNATTTIGNMAPSILASTVLGPAGLGASAAVASSAAAATMGMSAAGNAYGQKLAEGYDRTQARTYSTLVGIAEGALQYALGGIGKLGGVADDLLLAKINAIDNALARVALTGTVKLGSEIVEEELQNFLEPLIASVVFNENYDPPTVEELVETAIVTAISTGVLESGSIISAGSSNTAKWGAGVDAETAQAIIEEGLSTDPKSPSYILAKQLQKKMEKGKTITAQEIGNLQQQNMEYVDATADPEADLRRLAEEAVAVEKGKTPAEATEMAQDGVLVEGEETPAQIASEAPAPARAAMSAAAEAAIPYNVLNNAQRAKTSVLDSLGYLDNGTRTFESVVETTGMSVEAVRSNFQTAYEAGLQNVPAKSVSFVNPIQKAAYAAGLKDYGVLHKQAVERDAQMAQQAPVQSKGKSGFQYDAKNLPTNVSRGEATIIDELSRMLGVSTRMVGQQDYNAKLTGTTDVEIASDFQTEMPGADGVLRKTTVIDHAVHEMAGHQVIKLAPVEGRAFMNAMYGYLSENLPDTVATLAEAKTDSYGSKKVSLSTDKAMEEVVVSEIFPLLYSSDPAQFKAAMDRVMNGKDEQAKKGARTFKEVLSDLWKKLKSIAARLRGKGDVEAAREAEQAADRVKELRDMFENAMRVAAQRVQNAQKSANETGRAVTEHVTIDYSKKNYWRPNLSKVEWSLLNYRMDREIENPAYDIDPATKWLYAKEKGTTVFAIYGIGDGTEATPLYASGGKKAQADYARLSAFKEEWKHEPYKGRKAFDSWIASVRGEQGYLGGNLHDAANRGAAVGHDQLHGKAQGGDGNRAAGTGSENQRSLKSEAVEFSDRGTDYSLREKDPPKKVGIAYKVFYAKDGQLYPPMVANPGGAGTPVGVWLDADVAASAPPSKTGRPQVQAGGKGTNAGKMSLAFRPGWHLGDLPIATQFARKNPETGVKDLFPADFVWAECEYAMDHDYQEEAMSYGYTENGKFRHSYAGLPRLPEDGYYRYRTNPNPDTVPWVITGAMRIKRILTDMETDKILRDAGVVPMKRQGGELNLEKLGLTAGEQYSKKDSGREPTKTRDGKLFRATEADGATVLTTANDNPVAMMDENGSAQFSLKTYDAFGRAELKRWLDLRVSKNQLDKGDAADIVEQLDEYYDLCQKFLDKYAPFGAWSNAEVVRDDKGKPVFSVVKANGEYAMNLDFSLVCKKRRTLDAVFGEMIRRGMMDNVDLAEADIAKINDIIRESGFETACALCFVDAKRYRQAKVADTFVNQYNELVMKLLPEGGDVKAHYFDFVETGHYKNAGRGLHTLSNAEVKSGIEKLKQVMRENGSKTVPHKIAKHLLEHPQDRRLVNRGEFMNTDGFGAVRLKNPAVLKLYNSSKGSGGPKAAFSDVQYLGEILKKNNFTPGRAYAVGGVRIQSFSDYIPRLVFDYLQMVADLSAKKLPAHAYTKEATFVKQFGMTGIKMNMSLVPAVAADGVAAGLDKNGNYYWFDGQSFGSDVGVKGSGQTGFELAIEIQNAPGYSEHCGTIAVGVSDEHIWKMLDDENIRMIIPYHKSSLNHIVAVMNNIDKYTDYTKVQNTRVKATGSKITGKDFNFNEALRRLGDAKAAANEYLAWCEKNGYIPKFDTFAGHENYYKVLEDFSTYDNGVAAPQGPVTMTFPKDGDVFGSMAELIEQGLDEDAVLEGRRDKSLGAIVDKVEGVLKQREDEQFSMKDSDGRDLSEGQVEYFKDSVVRDKDGNLLTMYHATRAEFTSFDRGKIGSSGAGRYLGYGFNFAASEITAGQYGGRMMEVYLNIRSPLSDQNKSLTSGHVARLIMMIDEATPDFADDISQSVAWEYSGSGYNISPRDSEQVQMAKYRKAVNEAARSIIDYADSDADIYAQLSMAAGDASAVMDTFSQIDRDGVLWHNDDGSIQYAITFDSNQSKDTENLSPTESDDINFSMKEQTELMRDNARLKEVNAALKAQLQTTKFAKVDKKALDSFTKELLKGWQSGADINEIRNALDALYTYLANGEDGQGPTWERAFRMAYDTAVQVLENVSILNDDLYREYADLRNYLRTTGISMSRDYEHDLGRYESLAEFRKANWGRILIKNDGLDINTAYTELANMFPMWFDDRVHSHPGDQMAHLAEVLDELQPVEENPYSYNMREAATWLANDIMERFFSLPQAKPTFADKAQRKLTEQVIKDAKKLENVRAKKNERIAEIIAEFREEKQRAIRKEKDSKWEKVKEVKEHYKAKEAKMSESKKKTVLRAKILRHVKPMTEKLMHPSNKKHVPKDLHDTVLELLDAINLESSGGAITKRTEAFRKLREQFAAVKARGGDNMTIDPSLLGSMDDGIPSKLDAVLNMRDKPLADMTLSELTTVWEVLKATERAISTANKALSDAKRAEIGEWATDFEEDTKTRKQKNSLTKGHFMMDIEDPYTFFHHFGEAGHDLWRMLRGAQDKQTLMKREIEKQVQGIVSKETRKKLMDTTTEFTTTRGEKLTLSRAHIMEVYLLSKREAAKNHLIGNGVVQPEVGKIRKGTTATRLTEMDVAKIIGSLTAEERAMADNFQAMTGKLAGWANEAHLKVFGYEKFNDPNYWPIKSSNLQTKKETGKKVGNKDRDLANMGAAKELIPHANNAVDLNGVFDTFDVHASDMLCYAAWLAPMEDTKRLLNYRFIDEDGTIRLTMDGLLDQVAGSGASSYWQDLMSDINNGISTRIDTEAEKLVMKGVGKLKRAAVAANLRVVIQQPTAYLRAAMVLDPDIMIVAAGKGLTVKSAIDGWRKACKISPIAMMKQEGGYEIAANPKQLGESFYKSDTKWGKTKDFAKDAGLFLPGVMDAYTWGVIWNACEMQVKRDNKSLKPGTAAFDSAVKEVFESVVEQTQVVDGVLQRSQAMRSSSSLTKTMTSFMGEPIKAVNMVMRAYDGWRYETDNGKRSKALKKLSRSVATFTATAVLNSFAQALIDGLRDDDDEKDYWQKVWKNFHGVSGDEKTWFDFAKNIVLAGNLGNSLNPVGMLPYYKDFLSVVQGFSVERMDAGAFGDFIAAAKKLIKAADGEGKETVGYAAMNTALLGMKLLGSGWKNFFRDFEAVLRTVQVETDNFMAQYNTQKLMTKPGKDKSTYTNMLLRAYQVGWDEFDELYNAMVEDDIFASVDSDGNPITTKDYLAGKLKEDIVPELFDLYNTDKAAYEKLYRELAKRDLFAAGDTTTADAIASKMDDLMKKAEGVKSVDDLSHRYLNPDQRPVYDGVMSRIKGNFLWGEATWEQRDDIEDRLYSFVTGSGAADAESMRETLEAGAEYGLDETEYLLYKLALDIYDQPNKNGELGGTPTNEEKADAIMALGILSDGEIAYLWDTKSGFEAYANGVDMGAYVEYLGDGGEVNLDKMIEAMDYGIGTDAYLTFRDMVKKYDQPNKNGNLGTYTNDEIRAAIAAVPGLTRQQRAYLWESAGKNAKSNPWK